jgi:hypothetical protein
VGWRSHPRKRAASARCLVNDKSAPKGAHETAAKRPGNRLLRGQFITPSMAAYGVEPVACDLDEAGLPSVAIQERISALIIATAARTAVSFSPRGKPRTKPKPRLLARCDECGKTFQAARKDHGFAPAANASSAPTGPVLRGPLRFADPARVTVPASPKAASMPQQRRGS